MHLCPMNIPTGRQPSHEFSTPDRAHRRRHRRRITPRHRPGHRRPAGPRRVVRGDPGHRRGRRQTHGRRGGRQVLGIHPRCRRRHLGRELGTRGHRAGRVDPAADHRAGQHRRGQLTDRVPGRHAGRVGPGVQRQHARHIPGHPTRIARHDRRRGRPDRQCLLHLRAAWWRDVSRRCPTARPRRP